MPCWSRPTAPERRCGTSRFPSGEFLGEDVGMDLPEALRIPASLLKNSAEVLLESAGTLTQAVLRDAPALRGPAVELLTQVAGGLRTSATAMQTRVARFDAPEGDPEVTSALATDQTITDHQRRVLLGIYATFQDENRAEGTGESESSPVQP